MFRNEVCSEFSINIINAETEGILAVRLTSKLTGLNISIVGSYLPPENSVYSESVDDYFQSLLALVYELYDDNVLLFCGDYNARVGCKKDFVETVDTLPTRTVIDNVHNDHGISLIDFLLQSNMCIVNGRITPLHDGFTSISHRGTAVVDFVLTSHDNLNDIESFQVLPVTDLMNALGPDRMGGPRVSDHSILVWTVQLDRHLEEYRSQDKPIEQMEKNNPDEAVPDRETKPAGKYKEPPKRYKKGKIPECFLTTHDVLARCNDLIDQMLAYRGEQAELDALYDKYVLLYQSEMDAHLKELSNTPKSKKAARHSTKPFWCEELTVLWKNFHDTEKSFLKCDKNDMGYRAVKTRFLTSQKAFDKELKKKKRSHERSKVYDLEKANLDNPNEFWNLIAKMGPKKKSGIPWEVDLEDGTTSSDKDTVMEKWRSDFEGLLTPPQTDDVNRTLFESNIKESNAQRENENNENDSTGLNCEFTEDEVSKIVFRAKSGKAPGIDGLLADTMKNPPSIRLLTVLFNACLRHRLLPTVWSLGIINPIPKSRDNNPRVPSNYRGISLLPVTSKLYTAAISHRISLYLEKNQLLCNEQNSFRSNRSCLDHIFTLHNIC